jgi:hypothetical protein
MKYLLVHDFVQIHSVHMVILNAKSCLFFLIVKIELVNLSLPAPPLLFGGGEVYGASTESTAIMSGSGGAVVSAV